MGQEHHPSPELVGGPTTRRVERGITELVDQVELLLLGNASRYYESHWIHLGNEGSRDGAVAGHSQCFSPRLTLGKRLLEKQ